MMASIKEPEILGRVRLIALAVGLVASLACAAAAFALPSMFFPAYLVAILYCWGIALGCLAIALLSNISGGGWGIAIRRPLEAVYSTLPLLALLFVPILFRLPVLYEWARPESAHDAILAKKAQYLNIPFFQLRAVGYFALWTLWALAASWVSGWSVKGRDEARRHWLQVVGGPGLIMWVLTVTFASVDWSMSLEPHWFSSVYGVLFMGGQGVGGMAAVLLVILLLRNWGPIQNCSSPSRVHDLGNLLLGFVLFWTYISFSQFLIIWSGNLPEESPWYLRRSSGGWEFVAMLLAAFHFVLPFLLLLSRTTKRKPELLGGVAVLLLAMRFVEMYWLVIPAFSPGKIQINPMVLITLPAVGGLCLAMFLWRLPARVALPLYDPHHDEEKHHDPVHAAH